ncbi:uncharacterized protein mymx isoform X2 [Denticeps clupeoides]|uniref:uncharacterized protein mymx isoform X2 n=1 Tax=Denticeps clupeoides TaxID=299321 RepID=UPI0010A43D5F|nr:uncharacterized protein LOC114795854 isoform X2 [Denticeps clupeoides]
MSDSIVRKIQPFTIGTRLSVPSVAKCPDFSDSCFSSQTLDNCKLQHNLNDHVSLFLSRAQARTANLKLGPQSPPRTPAMQPPQQVPAEEDHLNKNAVSPTATARSIRKITISGSTEGTEETDSNGPGAPRVTATPNTVNNNNNNNIITTGTQLPRIVGVSSGNKLSSHLKAPVFKALLLKKDLLKAEGPSCEKKEASVGYKGVVTQSEVPLTEELFNQEVTQAEAWIKGKLQDLKDGCSFQRCPLKDWEEKSQALQRDLKDFENTLIQLNQTGEQLMSKLNPTSDMVRKQLSQLRDQWHTLKQTAASQSKALGGAKNLQEFNLKVERLEAWVKEKQEEEQALAHLLGENMDKMQLTRRILDLKQDEQLYRNLHEEINDLALKLEKQGKVEGRNISTRRKHVNKIWLKVQSALKDYHKKLQVALEMSSFYQQADSILSVVDSMRKSLGQESCGDGEIRDVASQIMMLDVTVSQLSNLHPVLAARVTQKQGEVKEHWALLQKAFRNEKPTLPLPTPQFTREDGDPVTPQSGVGMDPQRMLGKESERKRAAATSNLQQEHDSQNDITAGHQTDDESMSVRAEVKTRVSPQGHPLLHIQLQKFTVSADKTLSWLKNNVAMATEIGYTTGLNFNYEAAKRCQAALEQDILGNRARIELVKKEGRSLIRAQHPGSAKIEEFLGQLEVLWEELKRHYQRNVVVLQSSEEVNIRAQRVLQTLNSLEAWLEATGLYARQAFLAGDPESMSMAERESSLMEREMSARNLELQSLRQEVETLCTQKHLYTELLPTRIQDVEKKYDKVRAALSQQSSKLQDTRMLAEFLERVELEEEHHYCTLGQPLHSETDSEPSVLAGGASVPLMPSIGDPVEELREAVEMLNDTVRERGRSVPHDRAVQELLSRHASVAQRVEQQVKRCTQLATDVLESENEMAVRCEPERSGLDALQDRNNQLEADYKELKKEAEALENLAAQLEKLCPERLHVLWHEVQVTLQGWRELRKAMEENRVHLLQFRQLRDFFRIYLDMISWTEDTRSCIFSDSAMHYGKPMAEVLDLQIEQKFEEFEELAKAGKKLISAEHPLTKMIKERMEELRSMLGWILVHWRAQKLQWKNKMRMSEAKEEDAIYSEAMVYSSAAQLKIADATQKSCPCPGFDRSDAGSIAAQSTPWSPGPKITSPPCGVEDLKSEDLQLESGYEVMGSITPSKGSDVTSRADSSRFPPFLMLNEPSTHSVGGTVNLILSFNSSQHSPMPCPKSESDEVEGGLEPIHRVSTYLHVKENMAAVPVYESMSLPRLSGRVQTPASSFSESPSSSSPSTEASTHQVSSVSFNSLPMSATSSSTTTSSIFSSLTGRNKKRKKKRNAGCKTLQRIMGVEQQCEVGRIHLQHPTEQEPVKYDTHTWPLKERKKMKSTAVTSDMSEFLDYIKNPLLTDIEAESSGPFVSVRPESPKDPITQPSPPTKVKNHCRFLSLGSVLSFDLSKDMSLIPNIPDVITIGPPESRKTDHQDSLTDRTTALSTFKLAHQTRKEGEPRHSPHSEKGLKTYCHQSKKIPLDESNFSDELFPPPPSPGVEDLSQTPSHSDLSRFQLDVSGVRDLKDSKWEEKAFDQGSQQKNHIFPCTDERMGHQNHLSVSRPGKDSPTIVQSHTSHMVLNFKASRSNSGSGREDSADSGLSSSGSFKLCFEATDDLSSRRTVGRVSSMNPGSKLKTNAAIEDGPLHPDHQQFEEEEEELQDIWNHTNGYRQSVCSDIMYQGYQTELASTPPIQQQEPSPKEPPVLYRNLVTTSAPNLLVAEFRLPPSIQNLLGYNKAQSAGDEAQSFDKKQRRSWAAFPQQDQPCKQTLSLLVNETASDTIKLPETEDRHKYIYQYREEEEEEAEEDEKEVAEEDSSCYKDPSLLSLHMGIDRDHQRERTSGVDCNCTEEQAMSIRGHCFSTHGKKLNFPSMEGTLERKQKLQFGGKKAQCRTWTRYHAVLHRQTLCFYQERKETLGSFASSLPLTLTGAECVALPEYTKKPNCFSLRLRDGSEVLLSASSRFMMKKWMLRIQENAVSEQILSILYSPTTQDEPLDMKSFSTVCHCQGKCKCASNNDVATCSTSSAQTGIRTKKIVVLPRDSALLPQTLDKQAVDVPAGQTSHAGRCEDNSSGSNGNLSIQCPGGITCHSPCSSPTNSQEWVGSSKRRSHSFTSATYQRIKPVPLPSAGMSQDSSSKYSVTLFIGDQTSEVPRLIGTTGQEPMASLPLRSCASLPRPRNKSVFKKFFAKKE